MKFMLPIRLVMVMDYIIEVVGEMIKKHGLNLLIHQI
nr:MAG TPA: hypothetical protein [Bacteriophage sp.]